MTECFAPPPNPPEIEALYPEGSSPEICIPKLSAICSLGETQLIMSGALRQIFLQHFADPENVLNNTLRGYLQAQGVWSDTPPSGIYIETVAKWKPEQMEQRPAIVIKENDWNWRKLAIGDRSSTDWRSGQEFFAGHWLGSHTVFALGHEGAETQILASEVAKLLVFYGPLIRDQLELHRFQVATLGALAQLKEATENYVVPVTVAYIREENWHLQQEAPRLKRIRFILSELLG